MSRATVLPNGQPRPTTPPPGPGHPPDPVPPLTDAEVIRLASEGMEGILFQQLHRGESPGYKKTSDADAAYCSRLAAFTLDPEQIIRIWQESGRWGLRCKGSQPYVEKTARRAVEDVKRLRRLGAPVTLEGGDTGPVQQHRLRPRTSDPLPPPPPPKSPVTDAARFVPPPDPHVPVLRPATEIEELAVAWFFEPWVPRAELSMVVGHPSTGKSTLLAWLAARAACSVIFPGFEENLGAMFRPRLAAHGADLARVYPLTDRDWCFPGSAKRAIAAVRSVGAELVLMDPVDSYVEEGKSENDPQYVRRALESMSQVARETGAAVVVVRHPGKAENNVCPGSRHWRTVPRMIIELVCDVGDNPRRWLHAFKDNLGARPVDTYYDLADAGAGKPRLFTPGGPVRAGLASSAELGTDRVERRKLDLACEFIRSLLSEGEMEASVVLAEARTKLDVGGRTCYLAADRLGVTKRCEGFGKNCKHFWVPPEKWPE